ncbi:MAG: hypothetical protein E7234_09785 [Lachnospiraceae bacterium]|nr:hypothetical protein [Lachnospiraceae bacterium]
MAGGEGKVFKACCGVVLISMLTNGLTLMNVGEYPQMVIRGGIFLGAVILDSYQHMAVKKKSVSDNKDSNGSNSNKKELAGVK